MITTWNGKIVAVIEECNPCMNQLLYYREIGGPPSIHSDTKAEDMYLELEQLGKVLRTLSGTLEG